MLGRLMGQLPVVSRTKRFHLAQKDWLPYAMIAPAVVLVSVILVYPALTAVRASLFDMNLLRMFETEFVGLANYKKLLFKDDIFLGSVLRTFRWTGIVVVVQTCLALPVALFLNLKFGWRGVLRAIVLIPWVIPTAVTAIIWVYMFDANFGVVNELLVRLGVIQSYIPWIADKKGSFFIVAMAMVWHGFPFMVIMLLAALQSFPQDLYEAARIDGAGIWQSFRYVTLPQLMPTILLVLLLRSMWLSHHVDLIYLITDGGPGVANFTIPIYAFNLAGIEMRIGYASAVAVILAIMLLFAAQVYIRYIEKSREYLE